MFDIHANDGGQPIGHSYLGQFVQMIYTGHDQVYKPIKKNKTLTYLLAQLWHFLNLLSFMTHVHGRIMQLVCNQAHENINSNKRTCVENGIM